MTFYLAFFCLSCHGFMIFVTFAIRMVRFELNEWADRGEIRLSYILHECPEDFRYLDHPVFQGVVNPIQPVINHCDKFSSERKRTLIGEGFLEEFSLRKSSDPKQLAALGICKTPSRSSSDLRLGENVHVSKAAFKWLSSMDLFGRLKLSNATKVKRSTSTSYWNSIPRVESAESAYDIRYVIRNSCQVQYLFVVAERKRNYEYHDNERSVSSSDKPGEHKVAVHSYGAPVADTTALFPHNVIELRSPGGVSDGLDLAKPRTSASFRRLECWTMVVVEHLANDAM
ncbi:uncharacterized protein MELLADRAFT_105266 [Melampsora larici-populina 98AG31]|uniref:Uncharacterized protein n=1 Tax=Melampsora larici-populina (strain 98AG31 / pathotype 3-4-7) TaxID=747676 RepID=F4RHE2_MELLP|nr:uncharacterized protein MELLADRAFT_105266 [Melampsora larici-populina 98AG31]EGG08247.1 hypothetical protein MELLADRAFT_105266 [Melampsora larici-populina 98AG31]